MDFATVQRRFEDELRRNPKAPPPLLPERLETLEDVEEFHRWKMECRAHDAALLALGLVTPKEMQEQNAAIRARGGRIVRHAQYV